MPGPFFWFSVGMDLLYVYIYINTTDNKKGLKGEELRVRISEFFISIIY